MGANTAATIVPGHGTLFVADVNTALPADPLEAFALTGDAPAGFINIGHTSKDNLPAFTKEGGEKTVLDSWLSDAIDVVYAATNWGLTINGLQLDEDSLNLAFGGNVDTDGGYIIPGSNNGAEKCLVLFMTDGTGALLFYIPNTSMSLGDAPSLDPAKFLELPLAAVILAADNDVIPAADNGLPAIMKLFKSGLVQATPTISTVLPTAAAATQGIFIVGTGFLGVTGVAGVTIGGTNATSYTVDSDTHISAVMPAGAAGSAPVIVTAGGEASAPKAYTRA